MKTPPYTVIRDWMLDSGHLRLCLENEWKSRRSAYHLEDVALNPDDCLATLPVLRTILRPAISRSTIISLMKFLFFLLFKTLRKERGDGAELPLMDGAL